MRLASRFASGAEMCTRKASAAEASAAPYQADVEEGLGAAVAILVDTSGSMRQNAPGDSRRIASNSWSLTGAALRWIAMSRVKSTGRRMSAEWVALHRDAVISLTVNILIAVAGTYD